MTKSIEENDLPAWIAYYTTGEIQYEEWWQNGEFHRENDLPAVIRYKNGEIEYEGWYLNGELIRSEPPQ